MKLASGAELKLLPAPFPEAKALLQAFLEEAKGIDIKGKEELPNVLKNVFCSAFSSPKLDAALAKCMERCQYRGLRLRRRPSRPSRTGRIIWKSVIWWPRRTSSLLRKASMQSSWIF
jgi:hypothetical protein